VGEPAAVTFVQRFGGALNLHVHFHAIVVEALFAKDGDAVQESVTAMRVKVDAEGRTLRQLEEPAAAELVRPYRHGRDLTSQAPALSGTGVTGSPASPQIL
jgi:hypothetical protein